nr:probable disease resistance protein At1g52660 [Ziziphus jujuba var. spinosa]
MILLELDKDDDERRRAAKLAWGLRNMNNFVLIFDDVWQHFSLDRVGIPTSGNDLCIKVEPLVEEEAWELFTEKLGNGKSFPPEIESIAKSLAKKCSGLPLGIITMAGCMRVVEDITEWSDALDK